MAVDATEASRDTAIPDPALVVLIGPAGSGKSVWAAERYRLQEVVSSDRLRAVVGSGEHDLDASDDAFALLDHIVAARLRRGLMTVIDTLGLEPAGAAATWSWPGAAAWTPSPCSSAPIRPSAAAATAPAARPCPQRRSTASCGGCAPRSRRSRRRAGTWSWTLTRRIPSRRIRLAREAPPASSGGGRYG